MFSKLLKKDKKDKKEKKETTSEAGDVEASGTYNSDNNNQHDSKSPGARNKPPPVPPRSAKKDLEERKKLLRLKELKLEEEKRELQKEELNLKQNRDFHKKLAPVPPQVTRDRLNVNTRSEVPGQSKRKGDLDVEALRILEAVGLTHRLARETFFMARAIRENTEIYDHITEYVENGLEHGYGLKICNIIRLVRDNDYEFQHQPDKREEFRLLLWHGTKKAAVAEILEDGFKLPTPNGQMFGPGIYFADRVSKSANYCITDRRPGTKAYLFLCDVLLGNVYNARLPHSELTKAPNGTTRTFNSVKCTGEYIPDVNGNRLFHGSIISCGPTVQNTRFKTYTVNFNEFIVYSPENIKIMFLVEVEFTGLPGSESSDMFKDFHKSKHRQM